MFEGIKAFIPRLRAVRVLKEIKAEEKATLVQAGEKLSPGDAVEIGPDRKGYKAKTPDMDTTPTRERISALAGADLIGRQGGQKRNRVHIYRQPFGYPIRLCDHIAVARDDIEFVGMAQGISGPAEWPALVAALDWSETAKNARICKHCQGVAQGKRRSPFGDPGGKKP